MMTLVANLAMLAVSASASVSQVHLSLAGDGASSSRVVEWVSTESSGNTVQYGTAGGSLGSSADGYCVKYSSIGHLCNAEMTGLQADARIEYQIEKSFSANFSTGTVGGRPAVVAIFADMGYENAMSVPHLIEETNRGAFDAIVHAGDFAYDFDSESSTVGNKYMELVTPFTSRLTYMPCPGNHEHANNFTEYRTRFRGVEYYAGKRSGSNSAIYYAYSYGLTRFVHFSSEAFVYYQDQGEINNMIAFINKEVNSVDRSVTPWVVAIAHKSWTGLNPDMGTNFTEISPLISKGADFLFVGHVHNYQAFWPVDPVSGKAYPGSDKSIVTDPEHIIPIITGAAGNREDNNNCNHDDPRMRVCSNSYGYSTYQAVNATHAHVTFTQTAENHKKPEGPFSDDFWVVRSSERD